MHARVRTVGLAIALGLGCGPQSGQPSSDDTASTSASGDASSAGSLTVSETTDPGSTGIADASSSAADTSTGGTDMAACACVRERDRQDFRACGVEVLCELPMPCRRLTVTCPRPGGDLYDCGPEFVYDTEAMQCVLEVLRDDTPAHLLVDGEIDWGLFSGQQQRQLLVQGGGLVTATSCIATDVGGLGSASLAQSAGADHFAACLELDIPRDQYECLWAGLTHMDDPLACP